MIRRTTGYHKYKIKQHFHYCPGRCRQGPSESEEDPLPRNGASAVVSFGRNRLASFRRKRSICIPLRDHRSPNFQLTFGRCAEPPGPNRLLSIFSAGLRDWTGGAEIDICLPSSNFQRQSAQTPKKVRKGGQSFCRYFLARSHQPWTRSRFFLH